MKSQVVIAAFEFASPWALAWLAAAALPWLVNLWNRRRHVDMPWAAVDLLLAAIRERSRRLRWREWLLMAMRTAILVLAALAAARPLWRSGAAAGMLAGRTHRVFAIDQSFSMATRAEGVTRLDRAKERVRRLIDDGPAGDALTVIAWGESAENVMGKPAFDAGDAFAALDSIELSDGVAELSGALRAVEAAVDATDREFPDIRQSQIVFASDLTRTAWASALPSADSVAKTDATGRETAQAWQRVARRATIVIEDVDDGVRDNVAVVGVAIDPPLATLDTPLVIGVRVQSIGNRARPPLELELLLDGAAIGRQTIVVPPSQSVVARFDTQIIEAGSHVFEARLQGGIDALDVDDRRWLAVDVRPESRVICFVDSPGAAEDFARAINPQHKAGGGLLGVDTASIARLGATDLSAYEAALVCNVAELAPREQELVRRYVADGGAAAFVLGGRTQVDRYNEFFGSVRRDEKSPREPLLPIELAPAATGDWRLDPLEYRHPILAPFSGRSRAGLLGVRVSRYFPATLNSDGSRAQIVLALSSGDPAIVIGDYGLGRIAVLTTDPALTGAGEPWSTLAVSPSFLPLVRELVSFLAANRRSERLNRIVGQNLAAPSKFMENGAGHWLTPDGREFPALLAAGAAPIETRRRGVYTLHADDGEQSATRGREHKLEMAVNVDARESDLSTIDAQDLSSTIARASVVRTQAGPAATVSFERSLYTAAAALLLLELLVAWLLGRGWG